ncbi:MAG: hypothetical protein EOO27_43600 [Comamonadaceae bacterium]|nr:MAG: hypothetical protein EOO27_43600 [Comamonadaceae bacterium]
MTGIAAIGGIIGIGFGMWWADAAAAGLISLGILHDGISDLRSSTAELVDGAPRNLEDVHLSDEAKELKKRLEMEYPGTTILLRETGRLIRAQVRGTAMTKVPPSDAGNPADRLLDGAGPPGADPAVHPAPAASRFGQAAHQVDQLDLRPLDARRPARPWWRRLWLR